MKIGDILRAFDDISDVAAGVADGNVGTTPKPLLIAAIDRHRVGNRRKHVGDTFVAGALQRRLHELAALLRRRKCNKNIDPHERVPRPHRRVQKSLIDGDDGEIAVHHQKWRGHALENGFKVTLHQRFHHAAPANILFIGTRPKRGEKPMSCFKQLGARTAAGA